VKKVKSLQDLQRLMESLGAVKDEDPGFTSWTLDCGPGSQKQQAASSKRQAASALKQTQSNDTKLKC